MKADEEEEEEMSNKCEGKEKAASITKKTSKRKALVSDKCLPFSGREAQRMIARQQMLERIEKIKDRKTNKGGENES